MPWDDDADDEGGGTGPPLPADDRLWRHPSELGLGAGGPGHPAGRPTGRAVTWPAVGAAVLTGALVTVGALAITGGLPERIVEHPVVEKVAITPVVSSPVVRSERGVDAIADRVGPALVRLDLDHAEGPSTASGVLYRDDGLILTSAAALAGASSVSALLADGRRFDGQVVGADELTDVAVVRIRADGLPVAILGSSSPLTVGTTTVAMGSPRSHDGAFAATGVISGTGTKARASDGRWLHGLLQTDAPIAAGCTGGPLVDTGGAVIGIIAAIADERGDELTFATPIDLARRIAGQLVTDGRATHGWLGITGTDLTAAHASVLGITAGALVREVAPGGPAALAGLLPGDVITSVDERAIASMSILVVAMRELRPGDTVVVRYWRDGATGHAEVAVAARP